MDELDTAILTLTGLLFRPADRSEIDKTIKDVIRLLQKHKRGVKHVRKK